MNATRKVSKAGSTKDSKAGGASKAAKPPKYEFILIGEGLNDRVVRGSECNPPNPDCPKGVPSFYKDAKDPEAARYFDLGYRVIQGSDTPDILGGRQFSTEKAAETWLNGKDGKRFKSIYLNVYLVRVVA